MHRQNFLDRLQFQQQAILDQNIKTQRFFKNHSFVFDFHQTLVHTRNVAQGQFAHQALFIDAFDQSSTLEPMHFDRRADDFAA